MNMADGKKQQHNYIQNTMMSFNLEKPTSVQLTPNSKIGSTHTERSFQPLLSSHRAVQSSCKISTENTVERNQIFNNSDTIY